MNADDNDISVSIGPELAEFYRNASAEDQARLQRIFESLVGEMSKMDIPTLGKVMDSISDNAQAQGLTPEILEELLVDDKQ
ncbi:MAG: hypothetical protein H7175_28710 [Burkholderiales bacterium]|nr:hypothetical protein [Anaerolineae bacterium]